MVYFAELQDLQLGYNGLQRLTRSCKTDATMAFPSLITLNLDSNVLDDWISIMQTSAAITQSVPAFPVCVVI
jgi:hypothetical protein